MTERMQGLVVLLIDDDLLTHSARVMIIGAPNHSLPKPSREYDLLHWREGNHSLVANNIKKVKKPLNKLHKFVMNRWTARFVLDIFFIPQHLGPKGCDIFDRSQRSTPTSVLVNQMTSAHLGVEIDCE